MFSWHMFTKGDNCCDFLFASLDGETLLKLYLLIKKNLLKEQILIFKSRYNFQEVFKNFFL